MTDNNSFSNSQNLSLELKLDKALQLSLGDLEQFTNSPDLEAKIQDALGKDFLEKVRDFQQDWTLPKIEIRDRADIAGANAAYSGATHTIYISREFLESSSVEAVSGVLLEEFGHGIDWQWGNADAPGDEGAIFSALVRGESLDEGRLSRLKVEDDGATVVLDGVERAIERNVPIHPDDYAALKALYESTDGDNWKYKDGWDFSNPNVDAAVVNQWKGVSVDATTGRVTELNLISNNLSGSIPPELGNLSSLQLLDLYENNLSGSIPPELGNLSSLPRLSLSHNNLSGSIPVEMGNLSSLEWLSLSRNNLSGSIPVEMANLGSLQELYLYENDLSGSIPPELGNLSSLRKIWLNLNNLSGSIPPELGSLSSLEELDLKNNYLTGSIPASLSHLLPTFPEQKLVTEQALEFTAANYQINEDGTAEAAVTVQRTGGAAGEVSVEVQLANNTAVAPDDYDGSAQTVTFADGETEKVLTIPLVDDSEVEETETINLTLASPTGGATLGDQSSATVAIADNDATSVPIHADDYAALKALYESTDGDNWTDNTGWDFSNPNVDAAVANEWYGVTVNVATGKVTRLYLGFNNLSSSIPPELGNLSNLQSLYLGFNNLSGSIPLELGNLSNLQWLYLGTNNLSGPIPPELGNLSNLQSLYLGTNNLSGSIPQELGDLSSLQDINLSVNNLGGSIPQKLGNLSNLQSLYLGFNNLSGSIPPELGNLSSLTELNLQNNYLTGSVPESLSHLLPTFPEQKLFTGQALAFTAANYQINEDGTTAAAVTVQRIGDTAGEVSVEVQLTDDTAVAPDDYDGTAQTVTFKDGETEKVLTIPVVDDSEIEGNETINLTLASPTGGATLGDQSSATVAIADNDATSVPIHADDYAVLNVLYESTDGDNWKNKSGWDFSNPNVDAAVVNEWHGVTVDGATGRVTELKLYSNNLNGSIPAELGNLSSLQWLNLWDNNLSGSIPPELGNLTELQQVSLSKNNLSGSIPSELGSLINLQKLHMDRNSLSGSIPWEIGNLSSLQQLYLHENDLSGSIPLDLGNLSALEMLNLQNNYLTGSVPASLSHLLPTLPEQKLVTEQTLAFTSPNYQINEDGTTEAGVTINGIQGQFEAVTVQRTGGTAGEVSVEVQLTDDSAVAPDDYDGTAQTVTFEDGETEKVLTIPLVDDSETEGNETINLTLANPTEGATLGEQSSATVEIADNDSTATPILASKPHIFWRDYTTTQNTVWYMEGVVEQADTTQPPPTAQLTNAADPEKPLDWTWRLMGMADFDKDQNMDLLWRKSTGEGLGSNQIWLTKGINQAKVITLPALDGNWQQRGTGDFNGDGNPDILWRHITKGTTNVWLMNGTSYVKELNIDLPTEEYALWNLRGTGDFNGDGISDLLWSHSETEKNKISLVGLADSGQLEIESNEDLPGESDSNWEMNGVSDFNSDGKPDILWRNTATGENRTWLMDGLTHTGTVSLPKEANLDLKMPIHSFVGEGSPGSIEFTAANYQINEDGTAEIKVQVQRIQGGAGAVSAEVQLTDGSAVAPGDYDGTAIPVSFADGEMSIKEVVIPVVDDLVVEQGETINLTLANLTGGATLGGQSAATVEIVDNDVASVLEFSDAKYQIGEEAGEVAVTIQRTEGKGKVTAQVQLSDVKATASKDYDGTTQTVTFDSEETEKVLTIPIIDDSDVEETETINLALALDDSTEGTAKLGEQSSAIVEIADNDEVDFKLPLPGGKKWLVTVGINTGKNHKGKAAIDFDDYTLKNQHEEDTPVIASADGKVIEAGYGQSNGYYIKINHDPPYNGTQGYVTGYLHMKKGSLAVKKGDFVKQGQQLGIVGNTGDSFGSHLHFEVFYDGSSDYNKQELKDFLLENRPLKDYQSYGRDYGATDSNSFYKSTNERITEKQENPEEQEVPVTDPTDTTDIEFGTHKPNVSDEFLNKVSKISSNLGVYPEYLIAAMGFETGGTYSPSIRNAAGSGATGLIQFMPKTAIGLGTTTEKLSRMSALDQLDYVEKYFQPYKGKLKSLEDVYMAILWPKAIGKGSDYVLFKKNTNTIAYEQNKGLDSNGDQKITTAEATNKVRKYLPGPDLLERQKTLPEEPEAIVDEGQSEKWDWKEYTIKPGDTLSKIAGKITGYANNYNIIAKKNEIENVNLIKVGDTILVPDRVIKGDAENNIAKGNSLNNLIQAYAGNDYIVGKEGDDILIGGEGDDTISGGPDDDTLKGGKGKDVLLGGEGNDTYQLNAKNTKGSRINDAGGEDVLELKGTNIVSTGLAKGKTGFARVLNGLVIDINQDGEANKDQDLIINRFFASEKNEAGKGFIEQVGNLKGKKILNALKGEPIPLIQKGNDQDNRLQGGKAGDLLIGFPGKDTLKGDKGDDILIGHEGNDTLSGGGGQDILKGGKGNDTYQLNPKNASGSHIVEYEGEDTLKLNKAEISLDGLAKGKTGFAAEGKNLVIDINKDGQANSQDDLTIENFFANNKAYKAGKGFIETVDNVSGDEIIDTLNSADEVISGGGSEDVIPQISIEDAEVEVKAGKEKTAWMKFKVKLSEESKDTITVQYATQDDTATSSSKPDSKDYKASSGEITFKPGDIEKEIKVKVFGDELISHKDFEWFAKETAYRKNWVAPDKVNNKPGDDVDAKLRLYDGYPDLYDGYPDRGYRVAEKFGYFNNSKTDFYAVGLTSDENFQVKLTNAQNAKIEDDEATGTIRDLGKAPVLAIRGTSNNRGWVDDLHKSGVGFVQVRDNRKKLFDWLKDVTKQTGQYPHLTGHSLGGAVAQTLAAQYNDQLGEVVTFNSPGINKDVVGKFSTNKTEGVTHYITGGDLISLAGEAFLPGQYVFSSYKMRDPRILNKHAVPVLLEKLPKGAYLIDTIVEAGLANIELGQPIKKPDDLEQKTFKSVKNLSDGKFSYLTSKKHFDLDYLLFYNQVLFGYPVLGPTLAPALLNRTMVETSRKLIGTSLDKIFNAYEQVEIQEENVGEKVDFTWTVNVPEDGKYQLKIDIEGTPFTQEWDLTKKAKVIVNGDYENPKPFLGIFEKFELNKGENTLTINSFQAPKKPSAETVTFKLKKYEKWKKDPVIEEFKTVFFADYPETSNQEGRAVVARSNRLNEDLFADNNSLADIAEDTLIGGSSSDTLHGNETDDILTNATDGETSQEVKVENAIADFIAGETDKIYLHGDQFPKLDPETDFAEQFAAVASDKAAATSDAYIVYNTNNRHLFYNANGNKPGFGNGGKFATLEGSPELDPNDFIV